MKESPQDASAGEPQAPALEPELPETAAAGSRLRNLLAARGDTIRYVVSLLVFGVALWLLHREFKSVNLSDVRASFRALPPSAFALSLLFTLCNYFVFIGYDWLGVRLVDYPLSLRRVTIASWLYYAFSNALGAIFGGTPVRVQLYSNWGMPPQKIVRMIVFIAAAFWLGMFTLAGTLFVATPFDIPTKFHLPLSTSLPLGVIVLAIAASYYAACMFRREPLHLFTINFQPPPIRIALAQAIVAAADLLLASAALYVLLPEGIAIGYLPFTAIFLLAVFVALASYVPGGLGVLELVLVTMIPDPTHGLVASILAFRLVYYLLPLACAVASVAIATLWQHSRRALAVAGAAVRWTNVVTPRIATGAVFVAGLIMLISGALPVGEGRMELVRRAMPLELVEVSHFLGSVIGALLLILARALQRRIDAAWHLTIGLLGLGAVVSLVKGFDYEEAALLTLLLLALLPCRDYFYRRGQLLAPRLSAGWITAILLSIVLMVWIVLFSYRHVEYRQELWWEFAYDSGAPRSLRALLGAVIVLALVCVARLLRARPKPPEVAGESELAEVAAIVAAAEETSANLALLGDKRLVFSQDHQAVVMFGCEGNSWIAMGDPIGPKDSADDAAWTFREACDAADVWPVFYQVDQSTLGRYVEMGLSMLKLGEEARVPLANFSLEGKSHKDLRRTKRKCDEAGLKFEIITRPDVSELMPRLKQISDAWLGDKTTAEKGFSLGFFDEQYLSHYDVAVIRDAQNELIAFANLWRGANREELSIDLMRHVPDSPNGVMEYLFIELMLYGHEQGYQWFNLGMAPLAGVESHRLAPLWNRASNLLFRHGEHFYNFQGLRGFKHKFGPEWFPKYLASPGGMATPQILANVSTLISGGLGRLLLR